MTRSAIVKWGIAISIAGAVVIAALLGRQGAVVEGVSLGAATVTRGDLAVTVSATGALNPLIVVQVGSQVSGVIQSLNANFNSRVRKGQVIAQIEPSLIEAQVAQAQASLKSSEAARDKAEVAADDAKRQLDRVTELREKNLISESDVDSAKYAHQSALVELRVRDAAVAQARAALQQAEVSLRHTTIYAPIDGVVISRDVDVGQTVAASLQAPTLFSIAQDLARMQIETEVDEAFIGVVREGQPVKFSVFAYPNRTFSGQVAQVRLKPKVESGVVKYICVLHVNNDDFTLKPGMTATVTIEVDRRENVLKVPNAALRYVPELPAEQLKKLRADVKRGEAMLWIEAPAGVTPLKVKTGLVGEKETEVFGEGVTEGLAIIVPGAADAKNGTARRRPGLRLF
jgi:HlyD family secretion protein